MDAKGFRVIKRRDLGQKALQAKNTFIDTGDMVNTTMIVMSLDGAKK